MAAGDVTVEIVDTPITSAAIDAILTSMRVTANDKYLMTSIDNQIIIAHIEEA